MSFVKSKEEEEIVGMVYKFYKIMNFIKIKELSYATTNAS